MILSSSLFFRFYGQSLLSHPFPYSVFFSISIIKFSRKNKMNSNIFPPSKHQNQLSLQQSISNLQSQCSNLLNKVSQSLNPLFNLNKNNNPNIFSTLNSLQDQAKQALFNSVSRFGNAPVWTRISDEGGVARTQVTTTPIRGIGKGLYADAMEERLAGVPVYALSNSNKE